MKIVIKLASGDELESLPTDIADMDREHAAKQIVREMQNGSGFFTMHTQAGTVLIAAELLKTSIIHILW